MLPEGPRSRCDIAYLHLLVRAKAIFDVGKVHPGQSYTCRPLFELVDIMVKHLEYPTSDNRDEKDLFDGDREQEEKFRAFRHSMGDVLKDCCEVIGVTECLTKSFILIQQWGQRYGSQ